MANYRMNAETGRVGFMEPDPIELKIVMYPGSGQIQLLGPLADKELTLIMLRSAIELVENSSPEQLQSSN